MKKPVVDYREFRFSKLNTPQFSHMKLAILGWLFYFSFYFLTENLIPAEICHPIHCALDDMIPFCEYFAVFYVFWYLLVFGSLIYTPFIYSFDTSTGVLPSLHVAYSMGILSVALKMPDLKKGWKWALGILVVLICLATAFVKQHSMLDVFAALPVSLVAELLVYWGDYWKPRFSRKNA